MRAACGWERGRSGQGKYNEEASGSWVVNAWGSGRSRSARDADKQYAGGGRGCAVGRKALRGVWRAPWETLSLQLPLPLPPVHSQTQMRTGHMNRRSEISKVTDFWFAVGPRCPFLWV